MHPFLDPGPQSGGADWSVPPRWDISRRLTRRCMPIAVQSTGSGYGRDERQRPHSLTA